MAYTQKIRNRAFELWCIESTEEAVAEQLRREFPDAGNVNRKTIGKWRIEDNWDDRRDEVRGQYLKEQDKRLAEELSDIEGNLLKLLKEMFDELFTLDNKTYGQVVNALPAILKQYRAFSGVDGSGGELRPEQFRRVLSRVLKALVTVPAIRNVMTDEVKSDVVAAVETEFAGS